MHQVHMSPFGTYNKFLTSVMENVDLLLLDLHVVPTPILYMFKYYF